jgi:hypothetical protein
MSKPIIFFLFLFIFNQAVAQLVEVQANYNAVGDVDFVAYNNTQAPLFLNIDFADLENTTFNEPLPYIKMVEPGFNALFTLMRHLDAGVPRFNYQIKTYRSNPRSIVDLDFPYLIPLAPGKEISVFDVKSIEGFWGMEEPDSWNATGFNVQPGEDVFASRNGIVVEIAGDKRTTDPSKWYHTWNNSVTVLQPDGTLMCYKNVEVTGKKIKVSEKIYAGQIIGEISTNSNQLIQLIFQHSLNSEKLRFIIPQYVIGVDKQELLISSTKYEIVHPAQVVGKEMSNKEKRKFLK